MIDQQSIAPLEGKIGQLQLEKYDKPIIGKLLSVQENSIVFQTRKATSVISLTEVISFVAYE
jgi:hypothetical protein